MSIWATFLWIEPVRTCDYGPGQGTEGGYVEAASSGHYGTEGIRLSVCDDLDCVTECVLDRAQIIELRDALTRYLDGQPAP